MYCAYILQCLAYVLYMLWSTQVFQWCADVGNDNDGSDVTLMMVSIHKRNGDDSPFVDAFSRVRGGRPPPRPGPILMETTAEPTPRPEADRFEFDQQRPPTTTTKGPY